MLDVRRLEILKAVVDAGSVTRAAAEVGYTPSAISQSLAALERDARTPLFEKAGRGIRPTQAALLLAERAKRVMAQLAEAETALEALRSGQEGRLRLAAFATAGAALVPHALARFKERYPGIDIDLAISETEDALSSIRAGHIDLAVVGTHEKPLDPDRDLLYTHLLDDPYRVVLPRQHPKASKRSVALEELSDNTWISTASARCNCLDTVTTACARAGFSPRFGLEGDEFATTLGLVGAGLGIAMVPMLALTTVPENVRVCRIRKEAPKRHVYCVSRGGASHRVAVDALQEALRVSAAPFLRSVA
jgi:DNA-binding transcriptional LysR family regulator